jgi:hypothetical protein
MKVREIEPDIAKHPARQCPATADGGIFQDDIFGRETANHGIMAASDR